MKISESQTQKVFVVSRKIAIYCFFSFLISGGVSFILIYLKVEWSWLEFVAKVLLTVAFLGIAIGGITPGVLLIFGVPQLAHAWLRGLNPVIWMTPWEQSSGFQKFLIYFWSILLSSFTLLAIVGWIRQSFRR